MIDIKVALNPFGLDTHNKRIGRLLIANVTEDSHNNKHKYLFVLEDQKYLGGHIFGLVKNWDRDQSVFNLIAECINSSHTDISELTQYEQEILEALVSRL